FGPHLPPAAEGGFVGCGILQAVFGTRVLTNTPAVAPAGATVEGRGVAGEYGPQARCIGKCCIGEGWGWLGRGHFAGLFLLSVSIRADASAIFAGGGPLSPRACRYASWVALGGRVVIASRRNRWRRASRSAGRNFDSHWIKWPQ